MRERREADANPACFWSALFARHAVCAAHQHLHAADDCLPPRLNRWVSDGSDVA